MLAGFEAANTAFRIGDFKECIAVCIRGTRDALREGNDAEFWQFRCLLALCLGTQGRFQEALSLVKTEEASEHLEVAVRIQLITQRAFF